jgi:glycosyltransferase involved in cell wall biosynthesis
MITIVIPAYNEEENIEKCLQSLVDQKTNKKFAVILVDNNSTDGTVNKATKFKKLLNLTIIKEKKKGRGIARKTGFDHATTDIILSTDADTMVPKDWVEKLASALLLHKNKAVAVTGTCRIEDCDRATNLRFNRFQPLAMKSYKTLFGHFWLSGFNFGIYKSAYEKSGGFNPNLNAQEDMDLTLKVSKVGKIVFLKDAAVTFSGRRFKNGLVRGVAPYITTFFRYYLFNKENIVLSDPR